jgi:hypothetical protein
MNIQLLHMTYVTRCTYYIYIYLEGLRAETETLRNLDGQRRNAMTSVTLSGAYKAKSKFC